MARCGCSSTCGCCLTAGDGITITGTGNTGTCYEISSDAATNCEAVQDCVGAAMAVGQGLAYNDGAASMSACLSTNPGNALVYGTDSCLYVPVAAAGGSLFQVVDTPTVDLTLTGNGNIGTPYELTAASAPSGIAGNLLHLEADGRFYVGCADVEACLTLQTMAMAKITQSGAQSVPASAGSTSSASLALTYNGTAFSSGTITTSGTAITIGVSGRYVVQAGQRDNNSVNSTQITAGAYYTVGLAIDRNAVAVANVTRGRESSSTAAISTSATLDLVAGDIITARYTVHRSNGATAIHTLDGDVALNYLSVRQIPLTVLQF